MTGPGAVRGQGLAGRGHGVGVLVHTDQAEVRVAFEEGAGVTPAAHGGVDHHTRGTGASDATTSSTMAGRWENGRWTAAPADGGSASAALGGGGRGGGGEREPG